VAINKTLLTAGMFPEKKQHSTFQRINRLLYIPFKLFFTVHGKENKPRFVLCFPFWFAIKFARRWLQNGYLLQKKGTEKEMKKN